MFAQQELADEGRVAIAEAIPYGGFICLEGRAAAEKTVHFVRRQAFLEDALDGPGVVHEASAFGEEVFELADEAESSSGGIARRAWAEAMIVCNSAWVKYFNNRPATPFPIARSTAAAFSAWVNGFAASATAEIVKVHHGLTSPSLTGIRLFWCSKLLSV